ncbi:MAG: hypothetical protein IPN17_04790 [Deltaproteobacteria bacterium]|nr:hypothetical protein [Deltaproteobacteria bacterium]
MADESVRWFDVRRELRPTGVTLREYDFTHPRARRDLTPSSPPGGTGVRAQYDYPARFALHRYDETHAAYAAHDGVPQARLRQEMNQVAAVKCSGRATCRG